MEKNINQAKQLEAHEFANIFPMMNDKEITKLSEDIQKCGQREPIMLFQGKILDGRNRYAACLKINKEPRVEEYTGNIKQAVNYALSLNLHRRHLNESQRAFAAARLSNTDKQICTFTQEHAAKLFNVSLRSVSSANRVLLYAPAVLRKRVENGEIPVSLAISVLNVEETEFQDKLVTMKKKDIRNEVRGYRLISGPPKQAIGELMAMKTRRDIKKIQKLKLNETPEASTFAIHFTKTEMALLRKGVAQSSQKDYPSFIHDLVMQHLKEKIPQTRKVIFENPSSLKSEDEEVDELLKMLAASESSQAEKNNNV